MTFEDSEILGTKTGRPVRFWVGGLKTEKAIWVVFLYNLHFSQGT